MTETIKWSKQVRILTLVISALLLITMSALIYLVAYKDANWVGVVVILVMFFVILYVVSITPMSVNICSNYVTINKFVGKKRIQIGDISDVYPYRKDGYNVKIWGSSGLFGYTGVFKEKQIGKYNSYVGDYTQAFILKLKNGRSYMISSENRDVVIETIKERVRIFNSNK